LEEIMTIDYCKDVPDVAANRVEVDGDGMVEFFYYCYRGEESIEVHIADLETILYKAKQHHQAYLAYRANDFDDETYHQAIDEYKEQQGE
jgi:hypothetical protein